MPIYEYKRPDGTTFEVQQGFTDEPLTHDPDSGVPVTRVLHAPALHFKGTGFYNTDYGTRKRQRELAAANGDGKSGDGKDSKGDAAAGATSTPDGAGKDGASSSAAGDRAKGKPAPPAADKGSGKAKPGKSPAHD